MLWKGGGAGTTLKCTLGLFNELAPILIMRGASLGFKNEIY